MKRLKLIYNPDSGDKTFKFDIDICTEIFQNAGYEVHLYRCGDKENMNKHFKNIDRYFYDTFVVSGGDGSINSFINLMMKNKLNHIPLGIIPSGTANDFASFLKLPKNLEDMCRVITNGKIIHSDIGLCNDTYFINVCAGGLFSNVSEKLEKNFKETLGKFAYYIKAIEQMHTHKPVKLKIKTKNETITHAFDLFLVLNSSGTAGIDNLSPTASIADGMFDFIGFADVGIKNMTSLAIKFLKGEYLEHNKIIFFKTNSLYIESLDNESYLYSDLDGEKGPKFPLNIKNIEKSIKIFVV